MIIKALAIERGLDFSCRKGPGLLSVLVSLEELLRVSRKQDWWLLPLFSLMNGMLSS